MKISRQFVYSLCSSLVTFVAFSVTPLLYAASTPLMPPHVDSSWHRCNAFITAIEQRRHDFVGNCQMAAACYIYAVSSHLFELYSPPITEGQTMAIVNARAIACSRSEESRTLCRQRLPLTQEELSFQSKSLTERALGAELNAWEKVLELCGQDEAKANEFLKSEIANQGKLVKSPPPISSPSSPPR